MPDVKIQHSTAPIGTATVNGQQVLVFVTHEWRTPLDLLAKLTNEQQAKLVELEARIVALGG